MCVCVSVCFFLEESSNVYCIKFYFSYFNHKGAHTVWQNSQPCRDPSDKRHLYISDRTKNLSSCSQE